MSIDKLAPLCYTIIVPRGRGLKTPKENLKNLLTNPESYDIIATVKRKRKSYKRGPDGANLEKKFKKPLDKVPSKCYN
jgi:hypothetical protein